MRKSGSTSRGTYEAIQRQIQRHLFNTLEPNMNVRTLIIVLAECVYLTRSQMPFSISLVSHSPRELVLDLGQWPRAVLAISVVILREQNMVIDNGSMCEDHIFCDPGLDQFLCDGYDGKPGVSAATPESLSMDLCDGPDGTTDTGVVYDYVILIDHSTSMEIANNGASIFPAVQWADNTV